MGSDVGSLLVTLAVVFLIFLVIRAILLWYWRVNEGIALLKSIDEKLGVLTTKSG